MPHLLLAAIPSALALAWHSYRALRDGAEPWRVGLAACAGLGLAFGIAAARGRPGPAWLQALASLAVVLASWAVALEFLVRRSPPLALGLFALLTGGVLHGTILVALDRTRARGAGRRWLLRAGLFATVLLGSLTAVEALLRALFPVAVYDIVADDPGGPRSHQRNAAGQWRGTPGFRGAYHHPEFPGSRIELNDWGLRDSADEARPPDPDARSVLVVGDSFTFGTGVALEETYQELLEQRAAELDVAALRVYGGGIPGFGTRQERLLVEELAPRTRPDVVIVGVFEGNDFQDNWSAVQKSSERAPAVARQRSRAATSPLGAFCSSLGRYRYWAASCATVQRNRPWLDPLLVGLGVIDPVVNTTLFLNGALRRDPPELVLKMRDALIEELDQLRRSCTELGAQLLVLLIPDALQTEPARYADFAAAHEDPSACDRTAFHNGFVAALQQRGFTVVDTLPTFEAEAVAGRSCFHREGHWNAHGHAQAAALLVEPLRRALAAR